MMPITWSAGYPAPTIMLLCNSTCIIWIPPGRVGGVELQRPLVGKLSTTAGRQLRPEKLTHCFITLLWVNAGPER
jgi:hypothetical protein